MNIILLLISFGLGLLLFPKLSKGYSYLKSTPKKQIAKTAGTKGVELTFKNREAILFILVIFAFGVILQYAFASTPTPSVKQEKSVKKVSSPFRQLAESGQFSQESQK